MTQTALALGVANLLLLTAVVIALASPLPDWIAVATAIVWWLVAAIPTAVYVARPVSRFLERGSIS